MKNKILSFVLALCLIIPCALMFTGCNDKDSKPDTRAWAELAVDVSDAVDGVITIETAAELAGVAKAVNEGTTYEGVTIELANDIDLQNREWTPIGYGSYSNGTDTVKGFVFRGTFDGNEYTIKNLKVTKFNKGGEQEGTSAGVGLFGSVLNCVIRDVKVVNAQVEANHYVAVIAGFGANATIDNCDVKNAAINCVYANDDESGDKAGLIIGYVGSSNAGTSSITNCTAENSTVKADRDAGQIIGSMARAGSQSGNTATNVVVSWNQSGSTDGKSNTNITKDICGRVA